ncbi:pyridine nucleotide-disulfide oxidoreductase [Mycobacterium paraense]|uniref:Pyridine nucleotide-disulfide oxidoreductase n=1 Tax=Mycobacterium paraense TaxID=767916 RepID=A0A1X2AAR4_9MYCO|nr:FAD/NAD(P)-binding oxidoreductase [Mycobacterium paraense]MCV7445682.1 NAD(P)/FAD-dependent oxidoreductase [Mycobacterium paraense]ORW30163.1 pyridine nucleotide-disulfide oxidoreductase [Mycobacterium paraense]ORW37053.1 pyridine nucleotide-disulfide oxidoreductase [Mycobacterium paraense]ORW39788.1 pyridine nucleotide-disulfide oxidoreductase [Mycobacterium paraense]ORW47152.1 pyridine nucleotide-disulfide oxidoreductase [Mycobacterium paraense]
MPSRQLRQVVVVGAGVAGTRAAEALRQDGYDGDLTIVGAERHAPYHRPPLSKKLLTGQVHRAGVDLAPQFELEARVLRGASAIKLDLSSRTVHLRDENQDLALQFDGLVIASGATPRQWPGPVPEGVLTLRTVDDCLAIRERLGSRPRVVVVGGGFIGAEVAASCRSIGLEVVLIEKANSPLLAALGKELAPRWAELHRQHGVDVRVGVGVDSIVGNGRVEAVQLTDGSRVPADVVIVGLGVTPVTDWLDGSGLRVDDGVVCDGTGAAEGDTGGAAVVAAGDVARWWHPLYERHLRTEHWDDAGRQGEAAARTLLAGPDRAEPHDELPYFWSDQYDVKVQMLGVPTDYDAVEIVEGDADAWEFLAAYGRGGRTIAALSTIPNRVYAYRDAIANRGEFPPRPPE